MGRIRRPPGRKSPVVDVRIGVYGKGTGKWSLREAKKEWSAIRTWSRENGKDPRERKRDQQALLVQKTSSPTLEQACESFLSDWTSANEREKREYRNLLLNQVLPEFDAKTPVEHFSWEYRHPGEKTTRELMTKYLGRVRRRHELQSAARSLSSLSQVELSRCGEMVYRLVPSCRLMNASKRLEG